MLLNSAHLAKNLDIYNMILSFQMLLVQVSLWNTSLVFK